MMHNKKKDQRTLYLSRRGEWSVYWQIWSLVASRVLSKRSEIGFRRFEHLQALLAELPAQPHKIVLLLPGELANTATFELLEDAPPLPVLWLLAQNQSAPLHSAEQNPYFFWLQPPLRWREVQFALAQAEKIQHLQADFRRQNSALEQNFRSRELAFYQALQRAEQKHTEMVENALIGVYETTPQGQFIMANQSLANMLGYDSPTDLVTQVQDIAQQLYVDPNARREFVETLANTGKIEGNLLQLKRKDGSVLWVFEHVQVVRAAKTGEVIAYRGNLEDVTQLKQAEQSLRQSYQQQSALSKILQLDLQPLTLQQKLQRSLQILFETDWLALSSVGAIFIRDTTNSEFVLQAAHQFSNEHLQIGKPILPDFCLCNGNLQRCPLHFSVELKPPYELQIINQQIFCLPLYTSNELLGALILYATEAHTQIPSIVQFLQTVANLLSLIVERDKQQQQLMVSHEQLEQKVQMRTAELAKINQHLRTEIAARESLQHALELELMHRAQTEQVLIESENKFRSIIQQSSDGITLTDETGAIIVWNDAMAKITGTPTEQAVQQWIWDVQFQLGLPENKTQQQYEDLKNLIQRMLRGEDPGVWGKILEGQYIMRSGETRVLQTTVFPIQTPRGIMLGSISRDITEIEQIKQTQRIQSAALDAAANSIVITDSQGVIHWVNPAFTQLTGYTLAEVIGKTPRLLRSRLTPQSVYHEMWQTILGGNVWHGELTNVRKDGSSYIQEMTITPVRNQNHQIAYFIAIQQDITEQHQQKIALELYAAEQSSLYRIAATVSGFLTPQTMLESVLDVLLTLPRFMPDSAWTMFIDNGAEAPCGVVWRNMPDTTFEPPDPATIDWFCDRKKIFQVVHVSQCPPLVARWLKNNQLTGYVATPLYVNQRILGAFFLGWRVMPEITESMQTLLMSIGHQIGFALRNIQLYQTAVQYNRLKILNEITTAVTTSLNMDEVLTTVIRLTSNALNAGAGSVLLYEPANPKILLFAKVYPAHATHLLGTKIPIDASIAGWAARNRKIVRLDNARLDARWYPEIDRLFEFDTLSLLCVPLLLQESVLGVIEIVNKRSGAFTQEDEDLLGAVASIAAVAIQNARLYERQKHLLQERERTQAHLIQSEKMSALGQLTASIAHEINNPLQAVRGFFDLLNEEVHAAQRPEKMERYFAIVNEELTRIAGIVHRMRDFYRSSGNQRDQVDVLHLLDSVAELMHKQLQNQQIEVRRQVSAQTTQIYANSDKLKQVFLNLFINALDVMPDGGLLNISIETRELNHTPALWITLHDSGPGVPTEALPRLFEPFFTTKDHGSGLGLYICYEIMRDHHGSIQVENHPNGGCMVHLALPLT